MYIDIFMDTKPTEIVHPTNKDCLYAVRFCKNARGEYWHAQVTEEQYQYRLEARLSCDTWHDVCESKSKIFKKISADVGGQKNCPEHAFGSFVCDPKSKMMITTSGSANISTDVQSVPVTK